MADVLVINVKRLPLRLEDERADFELNANKYYVEHSIDSQAHCRLLGTVHVMGQRLVIRMRMMNVGER
jgi:hypothetical protein